MAYDEELLRMARALDAAERVLADFTPGAIASTLKEGGDPVTEADLAVNRVLEQHLPREGEGWLSEETRDDKARLARSRVWVVDPIDGTRELLRGVPEWCVSIALVEDGVAVAGGIANPRSRERVLGARGAGVTYNGVSVRMRSRPSLRGSQVLASRSESERGEWGRFEGQGFVVVPTGSVAYKLARVAAGLADATWTLVPKSEWDVAAGVALVVEAGGMAVLPDGGIPRFNRADPRLPGLVAAPPGWRRELEALGVLTPP